MILSEKIMEQLKYKPDSDTDDITMVLWKCLGIGEPLELIDDKKEEIFDYAVSSVGAVYR